VDTATNEPENLLYSPIPGEWLRKTVQDPHVSVITNGIPSISDGENSHFNYIADVSEVTSQSLSGQTLTVGGIGRNRNRLRIV